METNWQRILAESTKPEWYGDLDDDCTARWAGLMLRAECMQDDIWWWAVHDDAQNEQVHSSNDTGESVCHFGGEARQAAEKAARRYLGFKD